MAPTVKLTGREKQYQILSLMNKLDVIERFKRGELPEMIAKKYKIHLATVLSICQVSDKILATAHTVLAKQLWKSSIVGKTSVSESLENIVARWILRLSEKNIQVSPVDVLQRAKEIHANFKSPSSFKYTDNLVWLKKLQKEFHLKSLDTPIMDSRHQRIGISASEPRIFFVQTLQKLLKAEDYLPQQVFTVDDTTLYWKQIPSQSVLLQSSSNEDASFNFRILLATNASGTYRMKPLVVYKTPANQLYETHVKKYQSRCFLKGDEHTKIDNSMFKEWLVKYALPSWEEYCKTEEIDFKILLIVPASSAYIVENVYNFQNIKILYIPQDLVSLIHPMHEGIIQYFKANYLRMMFLQMFFNTLGENDTEISECWRRYNVCEAINTISLAWKNIEPKWINSTWRKIWPECLKELVDVGPLLRSICIESFELAYDVGLQDITIDGLLKIINQIDDSSDKDDDDDDIQEIPPPSNDEMWKNMPFIRCRKTLSENNMKGAFILIQKGLKILGASDPNFDRFFATQSSIRTSLLPYVQLYRETDKGPVIVNAYSLRKDK